MRPSAGKHARMRGKRPGRSRLGPVEPDPAGSQLVNRRAGGTVIPVQAKVVGGDCVEHDQKHILRSRGGNRPRSIAPLPESVSSHRHSGHDNQKERGHRNAEANNSTEAGAMPLQERHQLRRDAENDHQPGEPIDLGKRNQEDRQQGQRTEQAGREPTSVPGHKMRHERQGATERREDQEIAERDQPHEMTAGPVKVISFQCLARSSFPPRANPR